LGDGEDVLRSEKGHHVDQTERRSVYAFEPLCSQLTHHRDNE
jgi:hypothetical protein